jgi:hypothetical protein
MRSYKEGCQSGYVVTRQINKQKALGNASGVEKGLRYSYYEGIYRSVYDYALDTPVKTGVVSIPTLDICNRNEWIGIHFEGLIKIPENGEYTFYMSSNDGCKLIIDGEEQFESDGRKSHAFGQQASLQLAKGFHKIQMGFYQCSDDIDLRVEWKGPSIARQVIPKDVFMHQTN